MGIDRLQKEEGVLFKFCALPLHDEEIPKEGMDLEEFIGDPFADIHAMIEQLRQTAEKEGLSLNNPGRICKTSLAHEARAWAEIEFDLGHNVELAFFHAYFVRGMNLGDADQVANIVSDLGLPNFECREALSRREYRQRVENDLEKAREKNVTFAPTFVCGQKKLAGYKPYPELRDFVMDSCSC